VTIEVAPGRFEDLPEMEQFNLMRKARDELGIPDSSTSKQSTNAVSARARELAGDIPSEIVQIKGKANRAPKEEYLPAVQDFVRSGKWSKVGDLQNVGLIPHRGEYRFPEEFLYRTDAGGWEPLVDVAKRAFPDNPEMQSNFYRGASQMEGDIKLKSSPELGGGTGLNPAARGEGFAMGGLVQKYADGGLVGSNIYNSDAMQDPASAYRFADGGQAGDVRAYADGGLVANSPTADFDPDRIDAIVGDLNALNAG